MHRSGGGNPAALFFRLLLTFEPMRDRRLFLVVAACAVVVHLGALWNQFALDDVTNRGRESARAIAQRRLARVRGPILARQSGRTRVSSPSWRVVGPTITVRADGWTANVSHPTTTKICASYVGSTSLAPANKEGEPKCA